VTAKKKIAAVSFLNARPITYGLEHGLGEDRFELSFELPSRCAELLERGKIDLGLVPSASYAATSGELRIVPGIAIAGFGPVRTVLLVGEVPWPEMKAIALDGASRSSAMLLRLLCRERGLTPRFRDVPHDEVLGAVSGTTGALVIGDAGFAAAARFPHAVDLGAAWRETTGLPFVYAVWAGRPGAIGPEDVAILQESLARGLAARATIARAWSEAHGGDPADYERYLARDIRYPLGAEELSGLSAFFDRAHRAGLLARAIRPRLFEARPRIAPAPAGTAATACSPMRRRDRACRPTPRFVCMPRRPRLISAPPPTPAARRCTPTAR
jgi:cyclic dehypoxanthinyl futalosine synthase